MVHICFPDIKIGGYYYSGTVLRSVQRLSNGQYYIMEFELQNEEDDSDTYEWNVYQCVVDNNTDADIYGADMNTITGRAPLETFGAAKRALNELLDYLKDGNYGEYDSQIHNIFAGWADERRRRVYGLVLGKLHWRLGINDFDGIMEPGYWLTVVVEKAA